MEKWNAIRVLSRESRMRPVRDSTPTPCRVTGPSRRRPWPTLDTSASVTPPTPPALTSARGARLVSCASRVLLDASRRSPRRGDRVTGLAFVAGLVVGATIGLLVAVLLIAARDADR